MTGIVGLVGSWGKSTMPHNDDGDVPDNVPCMLVYGEGDKLELKSSGSQADDLFCMQSKLGEGKKDERT